MGVIVELFEIIGCLFSKNIIYMLPLKIMTMPINAPIPYVMMKLTHGVVYIGDGAWGVKPRIPKKAVKHPVFAITKSAQQFVKVEISKSGRQFWSITPAGEIIDHYVQFVD
jgi:hypothetical protein